MRDTTAISTSHRGHRDFEPHPAVTMKESAVKKPLIPDWVWQMVVGAVASLAIWTHGKLQGTEVALAQHTLRIDRLEVQFEKFDTKLDKVLERVK